MDLSDFKNSLNYSAPREELNSALQALWYQAKGDWDRAHRLAQKQDDEAGAWVHAHLHRVEGDLGNAGYWYRRAGHPVSQACLEAEWREIAAALLAAES